jgi:hypothetical protein
VLNRDIAAPRRKAGHDLAGARIQMSPIADDGVSKAGGACKCLTMFMPQWRNGLTS